MNHKRVSGTEPSSVILIPSYNEKIMFLCIGRKTEGIFFSQKRANGIYEYIT